MLAYNALILILPLQILTHNINIYVRPNGKNVDGCGKLKNPCYSMRYAIANSNCNVILNVEGPRAFEFKTGPIEIKHNVTIKPFISDFVQIQNCSCIFGLFRLIGKYDLITVTLTNFYVSDCHCRNLIDLTDARLIITNSTFKANGMLVKHSRASTDLCNRIDLIITDSQFDTNFLTCPFEPSISLSDCNFTSMVVTNSLFNSSPIYIRSFHQNVFFKNVDFNSSFKMTYFFHAQSQGQANFLSILNCSFSTLIKLTVCPLLVFFENSDPVNTSTINIENSNFTVKTTISGAALYASSIMDQLRHVNVKVTLKNCLFHNCSSEGNGGSVFLRNIHFLTVNKCHFVNNSAANGGALYLQNVRHVQLMNSNFKFNLAKVDEFYASRGGAIYSLSSGLSIVNCSFHNDFANFEGLSLYAFRSHYISICISNFTSYQSCSNPGNVAIILRSWMEDGSYINISKVTISLDDSMQHYTSPGLILAEGMIKSKNDIHGNCPPRHVVRNFSIASKGSSFQYRLINLWCEIDTQTLGHFN